MGHARTAAVIWLLGATVYLVCEGVAAWHVSGYSYTADYISDLGTQAVMNVGAFAVHGSLFLLGAVAVTRGRPRTAPACAFVFAAAANAIGNVLVGVFPSGSSHAHWHVVGAAMAILGGNAAAIAAGVGGQIVDAAPVFRRASIGLGVAGIACAIVLVVDGDHVLPVGLVERGAVYTIIAWELMAGVTVLRRITRRVGAGPL